MDNQEQINALIIQLTKQQQELSKKEKLIKDLETENIKLKKGVSIKSNTKIKGLYQVTRKSGKIKYGFTIYDENHKRRRYENFDTQSKAEKARRELLNLRDEKKLALSIKNAEITFDSLYKAYVTYAEANNFSMNTITSGEGLYRNYLQFFSDKKVVDITKQVVQNWAIEAKKIMPVYSYNNTLKKAKAIWNCALKNDITILPNPFNILSAINIKKERKNRENVRINMEQGALLIEVAKMLFNDYTAPIIACSFYAGMRQGEVLGLKWSDIDFEAKTIDIQRQIQRITKKNLLKILEENPNLSEEDILITDRLKTETSRSKIAVPTVLIKELKEYRASLINRGVLEDLCFTKYGKPLIAVDFIKQRFQRALKVAFGKRNFMKFHELRGSCATILHKKGVPTKVIQKLLRHGRASITEDIYIDIDNTSDFVKQELNRVFEN